MVRSFIFIFFISTPVFPFAISIFSFFGLICLFFSYGSGIWVLGSVLEFQGLYYHAESPQPLPGSARSCSFLTDLRSSYCGRFVSIEEAISSTSYYDDASPRSSFRSYTKIPPSPFVSINSFNVHYLCLYLHTFSFPFPGFSFLFSFVRSTNKNINSLITISGNSKLFLFYIFYFLFSVI